MYRNSRAAYDKYHKQLAALVASGRTDADARATLALLGIVEPAKPTPSFREMVESADTETAVRWFRTYVRIAATDNKADRGPLMISRRFWAESNRGAYVSPVVFAEAAKRGVPIDPAKLYRFLDVPTPTDAELAESWAKLGTSSRITIERTARKASAFANPRDDDTRLAAPLSVPMTEEKPRKHA